MTRLSEQDKNIVIAIIVENFGLCHQVVFSMFFESKLCLPFIKEYISLYTQHPKKMKKALTPAQTKKQVDSLRAPEEKLLSVFQAYHNAYKYEYHKQVSRIKIDNVSARDIVLEDSFDLPLHC